jgi:hypothetical protein
VSDRAWDADRAARDRGRVAIFNATRPDGLDGWTMDAAQYALMRDHILEMIDDHAGPDGSVALRLVVDAAQDRYGAHPLFPGGRVRNYCTFTKVDLEARCEIERLPGVGPQRIRRFGDAGAGRDGGAAEVAPQRPDPADGREAGPLGAPRGSRAAPAPRRRPRPGRTA